MSSLKDAQDRKVLAQSIITRLRSKSYTGLVNDSRAYVMPLLTVSGQSEVEKKLKVHSMAKDAFPFLSQLLKTSIDCLDDKSSAMEEELENEVINLALISIEGISKLREFLKGHKFFVELQHYNVLRRLVTLRKTNQSVSEAWKLLERIDSLMTGKSIEFSEATKWFPLPAIAKGFEDSTLQSIIVGVVCSLLTCFSDETFFLDEKKFQNILNYVEGAKPWMYGKDDKTLQKLQDSLCGGLYKFCSRLLKDKEIWRNICTCDKFLSAMFSICLSSSSNKSFVQIVQKLGKDADLGTQDLVISGSWKIYSAALSFSLRSSSGKVSAVQLLDLMSSLVRISEKGEIRVKSLSYVSGVVTHLKKTGGEEEITACAELYAVALELELLLEEIEKEGCSAPLGRAHEAKNMEIARKIGNARKGVEHTLQSFPGFPACKRKQLNLEISKSFDFVRKVAARVADLLWKHYMEIEPAEGISNGRLFLHECCSELQSLLSLSWLSLQAAKRISLESSEEKNFPWHVSTAVSAVAVCTKFSCLSEEKFNEHSKILLELLQSGMLQEEESKWLLSLVYNIGAELFNRKRCQEAKKYFLFCFKVAVFNAEAIAEDTASERMAFPISELSAKCRLYVDTLVRCKEYEKAMKEAETVFRKWAWLFELFPAESGLLALAHSWIRALFSHIEEIESAVEQLEGKIEEIMSVLEECRPRPSDKSMALFAAEILSGLTQMEMQRPSLCQSAAFRVLNRVLSLGDMAGNCPLQTVQFLLEQCRLSRILPAGTAKPSLAYVDDALKILKKREAVGLRRSEEVLGLVAMASCVKGLVSAELDSQNKAYVSDLMTAVKAWEELACVAESPSCLSSIPLSSLLGLALSASDLLGLESQFGSQQRLIIATLKMAAKVDKTAMWNILGFSRLSHSFCPMHVRENVLLSALKLGNVQVRGKSLLEAVESVCGGSILHSWMLLEGAVEGGEKEDLRWTRVVEMEKKLAENERKTVSVLVQHGVVLSQLAKYAESKGDMSEALKFAQDGLKMRHSLLSHMFHESKVGSEGDKTACQSSFVPSAEGKSSTWPSNLSLGHGGRKFEDWRHNLSQWRILSDFLEALFQCGRVSELSGMVDDAEKYFREGKSMAEQMNFDFSEAKFACALGETSCKKKEFETSDNYFRQAEIALGRLKSECSAESCKACCSSAEADIFAGRSDLVRMRRVETDLGPDSMGDMESEKFERLMTAMDYLDRAQKVPLLFEISRLEQVPSARGLSKRTVNRELQFSGVEVEKFGQIGVDMASSGSEQFQSAVEVSEQSMSPGASFKSTGTSFSEVSKASSVSGVKVKTRNVKSRVKSDEELKENSFKKEETISGKRPTLRSRNENAETDSRSTKSQSKSQTTTGDDSRGKSRVTRSSTRQKKCPDSKEEGGNMKGRSRGTKLDVEPSDSTSENALRFKRSCALKKGKQRVVVLDDSESEAEGEASTGEILTEKLRSGPDPGDSPESTSDLVGHGRKQQKRVTKGNKATSKGKLRAAGKADNGGIEISRDQGVQVNFDKPVFGPNSVGIAPKKGGEEEQRSSGGSSWSSCSAESRCELQCSGWSERGPSEGGQVWYEGAIRQKESSRTMASLLVKKGLCFMSNGQSEEAAVCLSMAETTARGKVEDRNKPTKRALCGLELASALLNMSRMAVHGLRQVPLCTVMAWLREAMDLCRSVPLLFKEICSLVAILNTRGSEDLSRTFFLPSSKEPKPWLAAFFHITSVGCTQREQFSSLLDSKIKSQKSESGQSVGKEGSFSRAKSHLLLARLPETEKEAEQMVLRWTETLPAGTTTCVLSKPSTDNFLVQLEGGGGGDPGRADLASCLLVTRIRHGRPPLTVLLSASAVKGLDLAKSEEEKSGGREDEAGYFCDIESVLEQFSAIMESSKQSTAGAAKLEARAEKAEWWERRLRLDSQLQFLLRSMEEHVFGPFKSLLLPEAVVKDSAAVQKTSTDILCRLIPQGAALGNEHAGFAAEMISLLLQSQGELSESELGGAAQKIIRFVQSGRGVKEENGFRQSERHAEWMVAELKGFRQDSAGKPEKSKKGAAESQGKPLLLILDSSLQVLPWESIPMYKQCTVYRMPCLASAAALEELHRSEEGSRKFDVGGRTPKVDPENTFFVLNPSKDLLSTQAEFENLFSSVYGWKGVSGKVPNTEEWLSALEERDLFVYCGHGSGEQYVSSRNIRKLPSCSAAFLMGCGSGKLGYRGEYEPWGAPLSYLMAGSPFVVANLWDVTDKDIDRFSRCVLERWMGEGEDSEQIKMGSRKEKGKGKLEPRVELDLNVVTEGRVACKLQYLIGAAPVCYGVPSFRQKTFVH